MKKINDMTAPSEDARSFDKWFFSQSKKTQDDLRSRDVLPYCEMRANNQRVYEIHAENPAWQVYDTDNIRTESEAFLSREYVAEMFRAFFDGLKYTGSIGFRRHVELVRWALSLPGCLDSRTIARMYGRSHIWAQKRARQIRSTVNGDACGLFPHINSRRDKHKMPKRVSK
jgi:hypothetical protein